MLAGREAACQEQPLEHCHQRGEVFWALVVYWRNVLLSLLSRVKGCLVEDRCSFPFEISSIWNDRVDRIRQDFLAVSGAEHCGQ